MVRTIAELLQAEHRDFVLYLTGSLAAGLGSPLSDLDLVAVVPGEAERRSPDRGFAGAGGFTCDLQTITEERLLAHTHQLSSWQSTASDYGNIFALRRTLYHLTRFRMGQPLAGHERLAVWQQELDQRTYQRAYLTLHIADGATFVRDTAGFLASGDELTAWETSLRAVRSMAEAALGACGDFNYSGKFLLRRITDSVCLTRLAGPLWRTLYTAPNDPVERAAALLHRRRLSGQLAAYAFLYGWEPGQQIEFTEPPVPRPGTFRRDPDDVVIRAADGAVLVGKHPRRISVPSGLLWCLCDGDTSVDRIVAGFASATAQPAAAVRTWVHAELGRLHTAELLDFA